MALFDQLYKKYNKKISVSAQSSALLEDHLLPMMQVQDKATGDIVSQVFNFVDQMGGMTQDIAGKFWLNCKKFLTKLLYSR